MVCPPRSVQHFRHQFVMHTGSRFRRVIVFFFSWNTSLLFLPNWLQSHNKQHVRSCTSLCSVSQVAVKKWLRKQTIYTYIVLTVPSFYQERFRRVGVTLLFWALTIGCTIVTVFVTALTEEAALTSRLCRTACIWPMTKWKVFLFKSWLDDALCSAKLSCVMANGFTVVSHCTRQNMPYDGCSFNPRPTM